MKHISFIHTIITLFIFFSCSINKENLEYKSNTQQITPHFIKSKYPNSIIIFIKPDCPGAPRYAPKIKNELALLKKENIPYFLIAEVIYTEKVDDQINEFKRKYGYENEEIYLMDVNKYPKNSGIIRMRKRIRDFLNDICSKCDTLPYGPGLHVFLKNGKFAKAKLTYELKPEDIEIYKK